MKKITNEAFIERINKIFDGKYDTSKVNYVNAKTKVTLICPKHGDFESTPNHLNDGHGCPYCANRYVSTNQFINKAKKVHGDTYDYSKVNYINNKTPICITCKKHGDFWQIPYSHLAGNGCNKCNGGIAFDANEFIEKANEIHNSFYDYSQIEYINARTKVKIICPKHGYFWQTSECHLRGQGCPKCKSSKLENIVINALSKNNIRFIFQAHIGTLGLKTVDFKLLDYNIVIECQGEQHFIDTMFGNSLFKVKDRLILDEEKYNVCKNHNIEIIYFTIPDYFHVKNINIDIPFYKDKNLFTNINKLLDYVLSLEKNTYHDEWDVIRKKLFSCIPNIIETNHGFLFKNKLLFLYGKEDKKAIKSYWTKYYRNRKIKVKFIEFDDLLNIKEYTDWLLNN